MQIYYENRPRVGIVGRMPSFRRVIGLAAIVLGSLLPFTTSARAQVPPVNPGFQFAVLAMPGDVWQRFAETHPGSAGVGVFPDSRDPARFIEEIGTGSPTGPQDERSPLAGTRGTLAKALEKAGISLGGVGGAAPRSIATALSRAFIHTPYTGSGLDLKSFPVAWVQNVLEADELLSRYGGTAIVLGIGDRTPVFIQVIAPDHRGGILSRGIARRPGIVTPYDVAATLLEIVHAPHPSATFVGRVLRSEPDPSPLARVRAIAASLDRDASVGHTPGGVTVPLSIASAVAGLLLLWTGRRRLAIRAALAAWSANVGYIVALFVPTGSGVVRALVVLAVMLAVAALPVGDSPKAAARLALGVTAAFALTAGLAPLRPGGLPGTAIWGNPLISWRFFGLQNFEAGLIASGVVLWGVLAGLSARALAVVAVAAAVVIGAPTIGANFVGVLTFVFGAGLAVEALAHKRVQLWHVVASGAIAVAAFVGALLADAGSPVSHGGRAARRIGDGGIPAAWDFVTARLRLNIDLIRGFFAGWVLLAAMIVVIALLLRWGSRSGDPWPGRAAVWAGAAMALSSMVLEDSGFYSGAIVFVITIAAYVVAASTLSPAGPASAGRRRGA